MDVVILVFYSTEECWTKDKESLWEDIGREIMQSQFKHKKVSYELGFGRDTGYLAYYLCRISGRITKNLSQMF